MSELMHLSYEEQFVKEWVVASWHSIQHSAYSIQRNTAYRGMGGCMVAQHTEEETTGTASSSRLFADNKCLSRDVCVY